MSVREAGLLQPVAGGCRRGAGGGQALRGALFGCAVVVASALAFGATTGAMHRAASRVSFLLGESACAARAAEGCGTAPALSQPGPR